MNIELEIYQIDPGAYTDYVGSGNHDNDEVDALLEDARTEIEEGQRLELYEKAQEIILEEAPIIPIYHPSLLTGMNDDIEGYSQHPASFHFLSEVGK